MERVSSAEQSQVKLERRRGAGAAHGLSDSPIPQHWESFLEKTPPYDKYRFKIIS